MSCSQFLDQVQVLMHSQQVKCFDVISEKQSYYWLSNRKCVLTYMSSKEEFLIRQAVQKVNQEQRLKVLRQLLSWLEDHPHAHVQKIPEMCILFLNKIETEKVVNEMTFFRQSSFRNSLKRLKAITNRIAPAPMLLPSLDESRKCVKFNDKPTVYCISD